MTKKMFCEKKVHRYIINSFRYALVAYIYIYRGGPPRPYRSIVKFQSQLKIFMYILYITYDITV